MGCKDLKDILFRSISFSFFPSILSAFFLSCLTFFSLLPYLSFFLSSFVLSFFLRSFFVLSFFCSFLILKLRFLVFPLETRKPKLKVDEFLFQMFQLMSLINELY